MPCDPERVNRSPVIELQESDRPPNEIRYRPRHVQADTHTVLIFDGLSARLSWPSIPLVRPSRLLKSCFQGTRSRIKVLVAVATE